MNGVRFIRAQRRAAPVRLLLKLLILIWLVSMLFMFSMMMNSNTSSSIMEGKFDNLWWQRFILLPNESSSSSSSSSSLEASIWTTRKLPIPKDSNNNNNNNFEIEERRRTELQTSIREGLSTNETDRLMQLCGKFLYSSIISDAIAMKSDGTTFVKTGDIDDMWTRDSTVQISLYYNRHRTRGNTNGSSSSSSSSGSNSFDATNFRDILEGTLRRNAFYIVQDPYANAYESHYKDPTDGWPDLRDRVIGRGGWVATRNYELDSGAYFLNQLWDYYQSDPGACARLLQRDTTILDAVTALVEVWTVEQNHDSDSGYRYLELPNGGLGSPTAHTGMTWTGFRPSDDACVYHYLVPANIHAAAGLERILEVNRRVWKDPVLDTSAAALLEGISDGIRKHGIVAADDDGSLIYAYEVDGLGNALRDYDDANVPSLLSIALLGWTGTDNAVYENTRRRLLSKKNEFYYEGSFASGIGSTHTPRGMVWPMALVIQALTATTAGSSVAVADGMEDAAAAVEIRTKLRELIRVASCHNAMHESVDSDKGCQIRTREWFEWANALFVILVEAALGERCDTIGQELVHQKQAASSSSAAGTTGKFYSNKYHNDPTNPLNYQGIQAFITYEETEE